LNLKVFKIKYIQDELAERDGSRTALTNTGIRNF